MDETVTGFEVHDIRFPTSEQLDGSDAMNPDPDYPPPIWSCRPPMDRKATASASPSAAATRSWPRRSRRCARTSSGGRGTLFGALTGVLTLQPVVNVMTLGGVPALWNQFLNGAIIIVALVILRFASGEKQD